MVERPPAGTIPDAPGSYQFRDAEGRVLYVGKAKSLRNRLNSYFGRRDRMIARTAQMLDEAASGWPTSSRRSCSSSPSSRSTGPGSTST